MYYSMRNKKEMKMENLTSTKELLNGLIVELFYFIQAIQEKNLKDKGVELSMSEVHLLEMVYHSKNNTVTHIAESMLITKATFSINASRLIKKGYLVKEKDEHDKRIVRVTVTEKAVDILKIHDEFHENLMEVAMKGFDLQESQLLTQSFDSLLKYLRAQYNVRSKKVIKKTKKVEE